MIKAEVSKMFENIKPWDCSNSVANLGPNAATLTWENAHKVASKHLGWLYSPINELCDAMQAWCKESGALDTEEIEKMKELDFIALFVQIIAAELRLLKSDNHYLKSCVKIYYETDWEKESEYPVGIYYFQYNAIYVDYSPTSDFAITRAK